MFSPLKSRAYERCKPACKLCTNFSKFVNLCIALGHC